ncbi:MAG: hypothetical protein OXC29_23595, partial [Rhodococcus sp.]|nr:hypothetical protein [Rhodococcus sp. (in: high G+C Gram-positive bacteria)]
MLTLEEGADEVTGQDECLDLEGVPGGGWEPNVGVVAVFVSVGASTNMGYEGRIVDAECVSRSIACVRQDGVDSTYRTRYGRLEVIVNPQRFCRDAGAQPTTACGIDIQPAGQDTDDDLHYLIAHELGHAVSLGDYYCQYRDLDNPDNATNRHPDFIDVPTLMNSFSLSALALRRTCNSPDGSPTTRDVRDYRTIYLPAAVTAVVGSASGQIVTLTWDQSNVFVESGFEIQRLDGTTWIEVATAPANADSAELPGQLGGRKSYQVVAKTMALSTDNAEHGHVHGPPSEEVTVTVKFPVPGNPRVATPGTDSLNFEWDQVVGADGYDVRRIGRPDSSTCDSTAEEQATVSGSPPGRSHRFATGLKASTAYLLCVRATKAGYPDATSDWASTKATTKSRSVTPPQPTTKTCPDGTVVQINQPCPRPQKPAPVVETQRARQTTEFQWRLYGDGIPGARPPNPPGTCYIELYQRERYVLTEFEIPWRWDARQSKWVLDRANQKQVGLESDFLYTHWRAAGDRRDLTCPGAGGDSNGANAPAKPEIGMLLPGDYVTAWDGERYSFTIPDGPLVNLETRRVGERDLMVFSLATGVALAIVPPQAFADPPVVDDPTLAAIVRSFQLERDPANLSAGQERDGSEACVETPDREGEGALSLNLDAQWCLVVHGGGDVTV